MKKLTLLFCFFISAISMFAQGTITGTMLDKATGEPLMFASVYVDGTQKGTETDFDGKFELQVEAGTYTIVGSYVGYPDKKIEGIVAKDKELTYIDFTMAADGEMLEEVVVKAEIIERSEVALLIQQRKSDKIQDAISSQEMSRYSVGSAAGAMKKMTGATVQGGKYIFIRGLGDRYSLSQLNGLIMPSSDPYRNGAQLDLIPSNLLDNIVTAKTFTPDQPGTFTGGAVNIKTKSIPEQYSLTINTSATYNPQNNLIDGFLTHEGGSGDKWGFGSSARALPEFIVTEGEANPIAFNRNLTVVAQNAPTETYPTQYFGELQDRAADELSNQFNPTTTSTPLDHSFGFSFGNRYQVGDNPLGVILAGSFSRKFQHLPDFERANWRLLNQSNGLENRADLAVTKSTETPTVNGLAGLAYKFGSGQKITFTSIYNHTADKISRSANGERPDNIIAPDYYEGRSLVFNERELLSFQLGGEHAFKNLNNAKLEWKVGRTNSTMLEPDTRTFEFQYNSDFDVASIPESNVQRPFHFFRELEDVQMDYKLDFTLPLGEKGINKLKFGGMLNQKDRFFTENRFQVEENVGFAAPFTGSIEEYLAPENMGVIGQSDFGGVILGNFITDATEIRNTYDGEANVAAAYAMGTFNLTERLKFVGGARAEKTDYSVVSADTTLAPGVIDALDILPSAGLIFNINERMNLRSVYSRTVARPNMREIAPFASFDPILLLTYFGNADLQITNIDNADIRWEMFPTSGELIAVSAYYKKFKNPIALGFRDKLGREIQYGNPESAELYGAEFEVRKSLDFIAPALKDFKFSGNFSYIISRMDALEFTDVEYERERPFTGQPNYIINASLIYENKKADFDGVLSLNTLGDQLMLIGLEDTPDTYLRGRSQLDLTLRKSFGPLSIKVSAQNLLNSAYLQSLDQGGKEDFIFSKYQTGTSFGLGVSYTVK